STSTIRTTIVIRDPPRFLNPGHAAGRAGPEPAHGLIGDPLVILGGEFAVLWRADGSMMAEAEGHLGSRVTPRRGEGVVEHRLGLVSGDDVADTSGIIEPEHELGCGISVNGRELVVIGKGG